jgi:t-SNARE complex subunit (syntaxin)
VNPNITADDVENCLNNPDQIFQRHLSEHPHTEQQFANHVQDRVQAIQQIERSMIVRILNFKS